jgi:hypothetical protein
MTWHILCSVGVDPTFGLQQGGNTSFVTCKGFSETRADAYTAEQVKIYNLKQTQQATEKSLHASCVAIFINSRISCRGS